MDPTPAPTNAVLPRESAAATYAFSAIPLVAAAVVWGVRLALHAPVAPTLPLFRPITWESSPLSSPTISPDGRDVVYATDGELWLRPVDGDRATLLTGAFDPPAAEPAFSPEGDRVAFSAADGIYVIGTTGGDPVRVAPRGTAPAWIPVEPAIAFVDGDDIAEVFLLDGTVRTVVENARALGIAPTPKGKRIVYFTADGDLFSIDRRGGIPVPGVVGPTIDRHPAFGNGRLWFVSERGGAANLWSMGFDEGSGAVRDEPVAETRGLVGDVRALAVSRDGRRAVFATAGRASIDLWTLEPGAGAVP